MTRLVRKVAVAKWKSASWASCDEIPSDAITNDLKTKSNKLSFWRSEDSSEQAENQAILALLGTLERIDKIDVVLLDDADLQDFDVESSEGNTFFEDLRSLHRDLANLNHSSLCRIASIIASPIFEEKTKRLTRGKVKGILLEALENGRVDRDALPESVRKDLEAPGE